MTDDLYFAYMGGEICYEVKQIVQEVFEGKDLFFLGYHEALTYIPSDKIIEEGGYEGKEAPLLSGFKGPFKKGIDETIRKCFQENYERLQK
jgi:neutral ceramidase